MKNLIDSWQIKLAEKLAQKECPIIASPGTIEKQTLKILPECKNSYLVFVDGHFDLSLSSPPSGLVIQSLEASMPSYGLFLQNRWNQSLQKEKEEDVLLNASVAKDSLFLYVPPKFLASLPLQIHHVFTSQETAFSRIEMILGIGSSLSMIQTFQPLVDSPAYNVAWNATVEAGASFSLYNHALLKSTSKTVDSLRAQIKKDANLSLLHATRGGALAKLSAQVELFQENSSANLRSLGMLDAASYFDCQFLAHHIAPLCTSSQHVKNALLDESRSNFEGKIYVEREAQKTQSYQLNQNLLLSNLARAESKPGLEIFADDVKASHGAIISQLSDEELFYLASRGLSKEIAKMLLVIGFCKEISDFIPNDSCKLELLDEMKRWIN